jgi:YidC/Oxa1 family membrane protein insertase
MFDALAGLMAWYYSLWPSYGGAIILLTLTVMLVLTPLTLRGTRSMLRMQRLQPEMKRIQKEFKDDRQRLNEELMAFYKENQINPLSSCLPLLIQMPVFIVLYRVLRGITNSGPEGFQPSYLKPDTALYQSLVGQNEANWLGINLAISPSQALQESFTTFLPYAVMIAVVVASGFMQQRQIQGRSQNQVATSPQQQMIMKILPAFIGVISFGLPGGLVLYFVTSNLFRVGQQWVITRTIYHADAEAAGVIEAHHEEKPPRTPSKGSTNGDSPKGGGTPPKGKPTPGRSGPSAGMGKGKNKRTTSGRGGTTPSLPQPRPRKKKR